MTSVWLADWSSYLMSHCTRTGVTPRTMKVPKSKYNLQCLNSWRYFMPFLKQKCFWCTGNYLMCIHCFETNTCACFEHYVKFNWCVEWHVREECDVILDKMQLFNFVVLNQLFCNISHNSMLNWFHFDLFPISVRLSEWWSKLTSHTARAHVVNHICDILLHQ